MTQHLATSQPLPRLQALQLSNVLEEAVKPQAHAVSCHCTNEPDDLWTVTAYYHSIPAAADFAHLFELFAITPTAMSISEVEDRNWVEDSLKGLSPVNAGRFFVHGAHDRQKRPPSGISIEIDAATAFGTGHHETTTGCLIALDQIAKRTRLRNVLDVGCGTGLLGIAAAKATHARVVASDIDPVAAATTIANARLNHVAPHVKTLVAAGVDHHTIHQNAPYDLIFANILAGPLVKLAPKLAPLAKSNGHIILSGLTRTQEQWVEATWLQHKTTLTNRIRLGNWTTLVLEKTK